MDRVPCPPGSAREETAESDEESRSNCILCEAGTYQPDEGKAQCLGCPLGYFCSKSSKSPLKCGGAGLYCPSNSSIAVAASSGFYTVPEIDVDEGALVRHGQQECEGACSQ